MTARKILCPLDFSPGSAQALRLAIGLAREQGARLPLMHVWYVPQTGLGDFPFPRSVAAQIVVQATEALDTAAQEARAAGVKVVTSQVVQGVPGWTVVDALNRDPAIDLVVVGTHGRTGLARVLIGSVAEYIVRHAPCPVLVARPDREGRTSDYGVAEATSGTRSCCDS